MTITRDLILLSVSLWDILTCLFLEGLFYLHVAGPPPVCFTARTLLIAEDGSYLSLVFLILSIRHISNAIQKTFALLGTLDCSEVIREALLHVSSTIKKTRNLWFEISFAVCMITTRVSILEITDSCVCM